MPRPRTITSSPTPARGRAGRRRSPGLRLRPPSDGDRDRATSGRAVAELARAIVAPAIDCACAGDPAGVISTCGSGAEAQASGHGDRRGAARSRPVAELAEEVVTPTIPLAAWCPAARMDEARCEVAPVPCGRHSDGDSAAVVTERAVKTGFRTGPPL